MHTTEVPEQLSNPTCPRGSFHGYGPDFAIAGPAWCKSWRCPRCGPRKAAKLAKRIARSKANRLLTLTVKPDPTLSQVQQLDLINHHFRSLMKSLRRRIPGGRIEYVKVVEAHKSGAPHLHVALYCPYIRQRTIATLWNHLSGSPVIDIRAIRGTKGAGNYLAKYLTKSLEQFEGRRKWSQSAGFLPCADGPVEPLAQAVERWFFTGADFLTLMLYLTERGYAWEHGQVWKSGRLEEG